MNPLNSQHSSQTQYFITTGMSPLAPASNSNSILKTSAAPTNITTLTTNPNHHSGVVNSQQTTNHLLDANNFMSTTGFFPVLLTNQTLITNVEQQQQQQTQQQLQKVPPTLVNVTNSPVVSTENMATFITSNKQQPMVMTTNPSGNITYQVLTTPQNTNLGSAMLAAPNGAVSVLLTTTAPPSTMATTSGHVAAPSFIIRNTPTALAAPNVPAAAAAATAASTQLTNNKQQQQQQQTQQQQYQHQFQQQILSQSFNSQQLNPEILKQIVVGNVTSTSNVTSGKTLLKPSHLPTKPLAGVQTQAPTKTGNKPKVISVPQQQQKLKTSRAIPTAEGSSYITTTKATAGQGMDHLNNKTASQNNKTQNINNNVVTQTVQQLPQVSLLQNLKTKSILHTTSLSTPSNTASVATPVPSIKSNEKSNVLKNPNEVRMGNINPEISLIKKSSLNGGDKPKEICPLTSLLKTTSQEKQHEVSLLKTNKTDTISSKSTPVVSGNINMSENKSLLKPKSNVSEKIMDVRKVPTKCNTAILETTTTTDKKKSLLNVNTNNDGTTAEATSPRNQRSKSYNSGLKSTQTSKDESSSKTNTNGRRHSEPNNAVVVTNVTTVNNQKLNKFDKLDKDSKISKSSDIKKSYKFHKLDEAESMQSEELNALLEEFEDEEYLESSGERVEAISNNNGLPETPTQSQKETENKNHTTSKDMANNFEILENEIQQDKVANKTENCLMPGRNKAMNYKDEAKKLSNDSDSDDDVTILPIDDPSIVPIEIDDDEEEGGKETTTSTGSPTSSQGKEKPNDLLLCDEQILISSSSSISNHSSDQISASSAALIQKSPKSYQRYESTTKTATTTTSPLLKKSLTERKTAPLPVKDEPLNGYSTVLDMLSNYNMLNWRERIGSARGTLLKFQLNEFNLIQVHERIPNRTKSSYEKPVYERDNLQIRSEANEPIVYYMCRRCNVRASAIDFLAPEFCSLYCLRRDRRKRQLRGEENPCILRKKNRHFATNINNPPPLTYISHPKFRWSSYLKANFTSIAAPISLFLNPFPTGPNNFKIGMKLEAIDPENCALFCVCTVVDINGYRLKLSFDGYDKSYDFWLNADSMDIFPPGWCAKTNRILQPPKGVSGNKFNWASYLAKEKASPAPRHFFTHLNSSSLMPRNQFEIGMHLEAEDLNDTGKLCVASIADILDDRIRIHFDGWDDCYDIIVDINSPYIHPCGWHEGRQQLVVPPDCESSSFNWGNYVRKQGTGTTAGDEIFAPREAINFRPNMKLEVVDPRNSSLIRPATVVSHKGHRVKLHLDGWPNDYCFWLEDDSPDLHPIGWCDATGHDLEPPPGFQMAVQKMPCPIAGCRGIGNAKKSFMSVHASRDCCPYAPENWRIVMEKPPRLGYDDITRTLPRHAKQSVQPQSLQRLSDQEILERLEMLDNIKTRNLLMQQDKVATSPKDLIGFSSLSKVKKESNKFDATALSASSSSSSTSVSCKIQEDDSLDVHLEISKEFLCDYGPRLQQCYTLWQKNLSFDADKIKQNPMTWLVSDVVEFVERHLKNKETANLFTQEDIDGEAFLLLHQEDLTERLGLKLGPAVKLYTCILQLRTLAVTKFNVAYRNTLKK